MVNNLLIMHNRVSLLIFLGLFIIAMPAYASVTARTDRTVSGLDETINLKIIQKDSEGEPDLSPLDKDFQVLSSSQNQQVSIINGQYSAEKNWNITLLPKKAGELIIPSITVGNESTRPIHLVIRETSAAIPDGSKEVFLKVNVAPEKQVYVQQQIIFSISLFYRINLSNVSLPAPELENAVIEKLGDDTSYTRMIGQHRYNVIERHYAIYPQRSGTLTIAPVIFSGNQQLQDSWSVFSRPGKRIAGRSKSYTFDVLPIPDGFQGSDWLAAENVQIESEIINEAEDIKAGEAFTQKIIITASGLLGSQLPAIVYQSNADLKIYPDKAQFESHLQDGEVIGTRTESMTIIPTHQGSITLPEKKIYWWNTKTNQQEVTILPEKNISVLKNPSLLNQQPVEPVQPQAIEVSQNLPLDPNSNSEYKTLPLTENNWFWSSLVMLFIWLMTLLLFPLYYRNKMSTIDTAQRTQPDSKLLAKKVQQACNENDHHKLTVALVSWGKIYFNDNNITSLSELTRLLDDTPLQQAIIQLEESHYSRHKTNWQGQQLLLAFNAYLAEQYTNSKNNKFTATGSAFAPLNPA